MQLHRHWRSYVALLAGVAVFATVQLSESDKPAMLGLLLAGDTFFAVYLVLMGILTRTVTPAELRERASDEDEGVPLILLLSACVVVVAFGAMFLVLKSGGRNALPYALLSVASVMLGWFMVHTMASFHYATLYYGPQDTEEEGGLGFPGGEDPGVWEFIYFGFVIGVAAQVSDVTVRTTRMRRAVLVHSIAAFFYNAVLLALTVNVALTFASGASAPG